MDFCPDLEQNGLRQMTNTGQFPGSTKQADIRFTSYWYFYAYFAGTGVTG